MNFLLPINSYFIILQQICIERKNYYNQMLSLTFTLIPCILCTMWLYLSTTRRNKDFRQKTFVGIMLCFVLYFYTSANYVSTITNYGHMAFTDVISKLIIPLIFPMSYSYFRKTLKIEGQNAFHSFLYIPAIFIGTISIFSIFYIGIDNMEAYISAKELQQNRFPTGFEAAAYSYYFIFCSQIFTNIVIISAIALTIYITIRLYQRNKGKRGRYYLFIRKSVDRATIIGLMIITIAVLSAIRCYMGRFFLVNHQTLSIAMFFIQALCVFLWGFLELFFVDEIIPIKSFLNPVKLIYNSAPQNLGAEDIADLLASEESDTINFYQEINHRFIELMEQKQIYLTPGLSIDAIAQEIGTNRAYVSRLLNRTYNQTFPEFINNKRIKYSKQLLAQEPDAVLEYIALKSGFSNVSQFTRKFKEVTGQSPRQWQKSNIKTIKLC